jgi:hypothetical protein
MLVLLYLQIYKIESEEVKKPSEVDRVFKQALREFKDNLVATYSVMNKQGAEGLNIKYKDLIANFLHVSPTSLYKITFGIFTAVTMKTAFFFVQVLNYLFQNSLVDIFCERKKEGNVIIMHIYYNMLFSNKQVHLS